MSADLQKELDELAEKVTGLTSVSDAVVVTLDGVGAIVANLKTELEKSGVKPEQLALVDAAEQAIAANAQKLADAVARNTAGQASGASGQSPGQETQRAASGLNDADWNEFSSAGLTLDQYNQYKSTGLSMDAWKTQQSPAQQSAMETLKKQQAAQRDQLAQQRAQRNR